MSDLARALHRVFAAACIGDALGAATEAMHPDDIRAVFGGRVDSLQAPPPRAPFALGLTPGKLTDDATQMLAVARRILQTGGTATAEDAVASLLDWATDADAYARFAGPTTRLAIQQLRDGLPPAEVATPFAYSCMFGTTNGAAMRAPAAGCARPGDPDAAAILSTIFSAPTHNTQIAFGGAGAIAASIAAGLGGAALGDLVAIADRGAAIAETRAAEHGRIVGGAGVRRRLALAAEIGARHAGDIDAAAAELTQIVGNGVQMSEAVPHAFGLVFAAKGDPWQAILGAVNGGNDSDTIAMFAGSIAAAFWRAADPWPADLLARVESVNAIDLAALSQDYVARLGLAENAA